MPAVRPVISLEFNELSPSLMTRFIGEGHLPNFARLRNEARVYTTLAEEEPPALEPWIQWVNVHSGLAYAEHGIFHLDEGHKLKHRYIWDILSAAGFRVLVCGSMNVRYDLPLNGVVIPDPWANTVAPHPASLEPYLRFVRKNVAEYTRDRVPLSLSDYASFLGFMVSHGLSLTTVASILGQLGSELGGRNRWRRATLLDKLQFDVFAWHYKRLRPHFSTFFINSTAHFQHLYWRNLEPEVFTAKPTAEEQAEFGSAVLYGYQQMDALLGRFMDLCGEDATLVFCTALSQQPCLKYEDSGGKVWYRPRDFAALLAFAGVPPGGRVSPVMSEEFHVYCERPDDLADAEERLRALEVGGRPLLRVRPHQGGLMVGCGVFEPLPPSSRVVRPDTGTEAPFDGLFYQVEGVKSGMHHPEGMLWIREPGGRRGECPERQPLTAIAPTVLGWFGQPRPDSMRGEALEQRAPAMAD